ncbi:MAG: hypothetical protein JWN44_5835 [Myxococcales bacterium]|nr:hypothetical protein [Myxococcales bacterium]
MRQFASSGFRIWNLSPEAKLVYTGFGVFALLAIAVSMLFYEDLVGARSAGVAGYYAGSAATAGKGAATGAANGAATGAGPKIEMPDETAGGPAGPERITVAVTYRKLLEVTHFHLFTVPVFLLIIAHLFMLTALSSRAKLAWIATGWISSLLHLAAPWLIRYGGAGWSFAYPVSGAAMALALSVMTAYPIVMMWRRPSAKTTEPARPEA